MLGLADPAHYPAEAEMVHRLLAGIPRPCSACRGWGRSLRPAFRLKPEPFNASPAR